MGGWFPVLGYRFSVTEDVGRTLDESLLTENQKPKTRRVD